MTASPRTSPPRRGCPAHAFDACIEHQAVADKYQTVAFDTNRYSVPRPWAFRAVAVKGYVDRVVVVAGGRVVADHARCYGHSQQVLDPVHYLATLERRPAALDHAPVYRDWAPTAAFAALRRELEERCGTPAGARQFIRVLQLLAEHPQSRVERAIAACRAGHAVSAEAIVQRTRTLAAAEAGRPTLVDPRRRAAEVAAGRGPAAGPVAVQPAARRGGGGRADIRQG